MPKRRIAKGAARSRAQIAAQLKAAKASADARRKHGGEPQGNARRGLLRIDTSQPSSKADRVALKNAIGEGKSEPSGKRGKGGVARGRLSLSASAKVGRENVINDKDRVAYRAASAESRKLKVKLGEDAPTPDRIYSTAKKLAKLREGSDQVKPSDVKAISLVHQEVKKQETPKKTEGPKKTEDFSNMDARQLRNAIIEEKDPDRKKALSAELRRKNDQVDKDRGVSGDRSSGHDRSDVKNTTDEKLRDDARKITQQISEEQGHYAHMLGEGSTHSKKPTEARAAQIRKQRDAVIEKLKAQRQAIRDEQRRRSVNKAAENTAEANKAAADSVRKKTVVGPDGSPRTPVKARTDSQIIRSGELHRQLDDAAIDQSIRNLQDKLARKEPLTSGEKDTLQGLRTEQRRRRAETFNRNEAADVIETLNDEFGSKNLRWIAEGLRGDMNADIDIEREISDAIGIIDNSGQGTTKEKAARKKLEEILSRIKKG